MARRAKASPTLQEALGSQLPWLLGRFNQAGMKASFTEFIAKINRPGFDIMSSPDTHYRREVRFKASPVPPCCQGVQHGKNENLETPL